MSRASQRTQQLMEEISSMNESRLFKAQGAINSTILFTIWSSLGSVIANQLKLGRGLIIPKFGTFTFTFPEVDLKYTTNGEVRDKQIREPVFLVSKEFCNGMNMKTSLYREKGLRPLSLASQIGQIQTSVLSFNDLAIRSSIDKDSAQLGIQRIRLRLEQLVTLGDEVIVDLPSVGTIIFKNGLCAVYFNEFLVNSLQGIFKETIQQRRDKLKDQLTSQKLNAFQEESMKHLDEGARKWFNENIKSEVRLDVSRQASTPKQQSFQSPKNEDALSSFSKSQNCFFDSVSRRSYIKSDANKKIRPSKQSSIHKRERNEATQEPNKEEVNQGEKEGLTSKIHNYKIMQKFKEFIKNKILPAEDTFCELLKEVVVKTKIGKHSKIDQLQFSHGLQKIEFDCSQEDAENLFAQIDTKNDGFIDQEEWKSHFTFQRSPLEWVRGVVKKHNLQEEDIILSLGIKKEQLEINEKEAADGIQQMIKCSPQQATIIAKYLLQDKQSVGVRQFLDNFLQLSNQQKLEPLGTQQSLRLSLIKSRESNKNLQQLKSVQEETEQQQQEQMQTLLKKIKSVQEKHADKNLLLKKFENMDAGNKGLLDVANFKACLLQGQLELTVQEIERIGKCVDKQEHQKIDYQSFLKQIQESDKMKGKKEGLDYLANQIIVFVQQRCRNDISKLFSKFKHYLDAQLNINEGISVSQFAKAGNHFIFPDQPNLLNQYAEIIDIDKDGFIDKFDLETFLKRQSYIESSLNLRNREYSINNLLSPASSTKSVAMVFPTESLLTEQLQKIIRDLKQSLTDRKISLLEAFKQLDSNDDGYVTITEFYENLYNKLNFQLSQTGRNGLFSYLDKLKIGMFNFARWHEVFSRLTLATDIQLGDNFEFQYNTISLIIQWFNKSNISQEEAFRIADKDFDGFLSKEDLRIFLKENILVEETYLNSSNIDRLFKLIDKFKKGVIDKSDFMQFIVASSLKYQLPQRKKIAENLNWVRDCMQQISLYFSKQNKEVDDQFEIVSNYKLQLTYSRFLKWIEDSNSLSGFNLTDKLLQQLFSYLDPHKKGYITKKDWKNSVSQYQGLDETRLKSIKALIENSFSTLFEGFKFFSNGRPTVSLVNFSKALDQLAPNQYDTEVKQKIWQTMLQSIGIDFTLAVKSTLDFDQFQRIVNSKEKEQQEKDKPQLDHIPRISYEHTSQFDEFMNLHFRRSMEVNKSQMSSQQSWKNLLKNERSESDAILKRLRQLLFISNKNIVEEFQKQDPSDSGTVTNIELKNIFLRLNLGLTTQDIDIIIRIADPLATMTCRYKQLLDKLKIDPSTQQLLKRSSQRIVALRSALYQFLISPKDAFRQADPEKKGFMTFEDFSAFMSQIQELTNQPQIGYSILKDLFDFIDVKGDKIIDQNEWVSAFMKYENFGERNLIESNQNKVQTKILNNLLSPSSSVFSKKKSILPNCTSDLYRGQDQKSITSAPHIKRKISKSTVESLVKFQQVSIPSKDISVIQTVRQYCSNNQNNYQKWESSSQYDTTSEAISKSRKLLLQEFIIASQKIREQEKEQDLIKHNTLSKYDDSLLPAEIIKSIISKLLLTLGVQINPQSWPTLIGFAQQPSGMVDFRYLLDVYKNKSHWLEAAPQSSLLKQKDQEIDQIDII